MMPRRLIPRDPSGSTRDRRHKDSVANVINSLMRRESIIRAASTFAAWKLALVDADIPSTITRDTELVAYAQPLDSDLTAIAALATTAFGRDFLVLADIAATYTKLNFAANVYTPTLTNVTNLDASTAYQCQYMRVGSVVTVSGKVDVDPTAAGAARLGISLPIASDFGAEEDCGGVAFAPGLAGEGCAISADNINNRADMRWIAVDTTNAPRFFTFTYRII